MIKKYDRKKNRDFLKFTIFFEVENRYFHDFHVFSKENQGNQGKSMKIHENHENAGFQLRKK